MQSFFLNEKDKKTLYELDLNPKISLKKLSKKVGINRNTLEYRINRFFQKDILLNYFPLINGFNLDITYFKYFLKIKKKPLDFSLKKLFKEPEVVWVAETEGNWDLTMGLKIPHQASRLKIISKINQLFEIEKKSLLMLTKAYFFNERWLSNKRECTESIVKFTEKTTVSEIDKKILQILYNNARTNIIEIAQQTNLSPETVSKKIKQLEKSKIILGYKTRINYEQLGFEYFHIFVSLKEQQSKKSIIASFKNIKNCLTILEFHGQYDIQAEIIAQKYSEVRKIVEQLKEKHADQIAEINKLYIIKQTNTKTF